MRAPVLALAISLAGCASSAADLASTPKGDLWLAVPAGQKLVYIQGYIAGNASAFDHVAERAWDQTGMPHLVTPEAAERLQNEIRRDMLEEEDAPALLREMDALYAEPENRGLLAVHAMQIAADRLNGRDTTETIKQLRQKSEQWLSRK